MALLSSDSFNRANSTTTLGTTDGAGTKDPATWTTFGCTYGINSNQAYSPSPGFVWVDLATADVDISLTLPTIGAGGTGIVFRWTDGNNHWLWQAAGVSGQLFKKVGSYSQVGSNQTGCANGDIFRVVANGSSINVYRNGVLKISTTDSAGLSATKHGMVSNDTTARFDDWSANTISTTTTVTGTQATETDSVSSGTTSSFYSPSTLPLLTYSLDTPSVAAARGYMVLE